MEIVVFSNVFEGDLTVEIDDLEVVQYITDRLCEKELKELLKRKETLQRVSEKERAEEDAEDMKWIDDRIMQVETMMGVK